MPLIQYTTLTIYETHMVGINLPDFQKHIKEKTKLSSEEIFHK